MEQKETRDRQPSSNHSLAIGFYISAIVLVFGVTLVLAGLIAPAQEMRQGLGINIDLWWGIVMVVAGCVILGLSLASPRRRRAGRRS